MSHSQLGWTLNPVIPVLRKRGRFGHTHKGRILCDDGGGDWSDVSISQGTPTIAGNQQKIGKGKGQLFPTGFG